MEDHPPQILLTCRVQIRNRDPLISTPIPRTDFWEFLTCKVIFAPSVIYTNPVNNDIGYPKQSVPRLSNLFTEHEFLVRYKGLHTKGLPLWDFCPSKLTDNLYLAVWIRMP